MPELGETLDDLPLLERLLRCENASAHFEIAALMWDRCASPSNLLLSRAENACFPVVNEP